MWVCRVQGLENLGLGFFGLSGSGFGSVGVKGLAQEFNWALEADVFFLSCYGFRRFGRLMMNIGT